VWLQAKLAKVPMSEYQMYVDDAAAIARAFAGALAKLPGGGSNKPPPVPRGASSSSSSSSGGMLLMASPPPPPAGTGAAAGVGAAGGKVGVKAAPKKDKGGLVPAPDPYSGATVLAQVAAAAALPAVTPHTGKPIVAQVPATRCDAMPCDVMRCDAMRCYIHLSTTYYTQSNYHASFPSHQSTHHMTVTS